MKLVEILAEEMEEWPVGVTHLTQSNVDREIYNAFDGKKEASVDSLNPRFDTRRSHSEGSYPIVTEKQWQAERDRQKGGEWKRHRGGKCPVSADTQVEVKHYDGEVMIRYAHQQDWAHDKPHSPGDIMKYRVISQPQAADGLELVQGAQDAVISCIAHNFEVGKITHGPIMMGDEIVGEASPEWNQQAKWDQIETPFKWRDEVTELNAYIEKYTRERDALIERLASEGFALIPPVVSVVSGFSGVDMSDWRNWRAGDIVVCVEDYSKQFTQGKKYVLSGLDKDERYPRVQIKSDDMGEGNGWGAERFKFHSRP